MKHGIERFATPGHGIEDGQQLARASRDGELFGLSRGNQAGIVRLEDGDVARGHAHFVDLWSQMCSPTCQRTLPPGAN